MPHLFCLPYQLAGWAADYPARRCPTRHPRPGGRLSAIDRRRGRSLGVGFQQRAIEIAAPLSAMGLMWADIADVPSKELAPRPQCPACLLSAIMRVAFATFFAPQD